MQTFFKGERECLFSICLNRSGNKENYQRQRRTLYNDDKNQLTMKTRPRYAPNNKAAKDKKQKLTKVKGEIDKSQLQPLTELPDRKSARI